MSAATEASTTNVELDELTDNRSFWEKTKTLSKKNPLGAFGLVVVFVMVFMAVLLMSLQFMTRSTSRSSICWSPRVWNFCLGPIN